MTTPKERMSEEMWRRLTSWLRDNCHAKISVGRQEGCQCGTCQAADMIDALRTAARTPPTSDELAETLTRVRFSCGIDTSDRVQRAFVRLSAAKAEAERNATQAFQAGVAHQERANTAERERDEARAALAQARADALEEAVKIVAGFAVPTSIPTEGVLNFIIQRDFRIAEEIRALKPTPTQESETP